MSNLASIVPPLDLCKQIPEGNFDSSVLAWFVPADTDFPEYGDPSVIIRNYAWAATSERGIYPAPTLQEILDVLAETGNCFVRRDEEGWMVMFEILGDEEGYGYEMKSEYDKNNSATAALKLWLELNKE